MKKIIATILIYIVILQFKDFTLVLRASLIFGFLIYLFSIELSKKGKIIAFSLMFITPIAALLIASIGNTVDLSVKPFLFWPGIVLLSAITGFGFHKLKLKEPYKSALLLSLLMLIVIPLFRKFGEGTFACLAVVSYLAAGLYILNKNQDKPLISMLFLFLPYIILHISDAILNDSFSGFLLFIPSFIISMALLAIFFYFPSSKPSLISFKLVLPFLLFLCILWPAQENYAFWIYSHKNPIISSTYQFDLIDTNKKVIKSSDKKINVFLFTSAHCGNCYKEYPYYSELAKKYSGDTTVSFNATFLSFRDKDTLFYNDLIKSKYSFKWTIANQSKKVYEDLKMKGVPTLLILTDDNQILYNGYCRPRPWIFVNTPARIIESIKR